MSRALGSFRFVCLDLSRAPMTEQEWLASDDPQAMLVHVQGLGTHPRSGVTDAATARKLRLFACACCRLVWDGAPCPACGGMGKVHKGTNRYKDCPACRGTGKVGGLTDPRSRRAVEVAERFADGLATEGELCEAIRWVEEVGDREWAALPPVLPEIDDMIRWMGQKDCARELPPPAAQAALLREVCGNPFRAYAWTSIHDCQPSGHELQFLDERWRTPPVLALARTIYADRDWQALPLLADALEEAGCTDAALLAHLRGRERCIDCHSDLGGEFSRGGGDYWCPRCGGTQDGDKGEGWARLRGPHVRGCWALDVLLGRD